MTNAQVEKVAASFGFGKVENALKCEIQNVGQFKTCLESVKFPTSVKSKFNVSAILLNTDQLPVGCCSVSTYQWSGLEVSRHHWEYHDQVHDPQGLLPQRVLPD